MNQSHDPWSSVPIRSQFLDASLHSDFEHDPIIGLISSFHCLKSSLERIISEAYSGFTSLKDSEGAILKQYISCLNRSLPIAEKLESSDGSPESVAELISCTMQAISLLTPTDCKLIIASSFVSEHGNRAPVSILLIRRPTSFVVVICNPNEEAQSFHSTDGEDHVQSCLFIDKVPIDAFHDNPCILYSFFRMATGSGEQFPQSILYEVLVPILSGRSLAELKCSQPSFLPYRRPSRSRFPYRTVREVILNGLALSGFSLAQLKTISHLIRLCLFEDAACVMDAGPLSRQTVFPVVQSMAIQISKHRRSGFVSECILKRSAKVIQEVFQRIESLPSSQIALEKVQSTVQWLPVLNLNELAQQFQNEDAFINTGANKQLPLSKETPRPCLSLALKPASVVGSSVLRMIHLSKILQKYYHENRLTDSIRTAVELCHHVETFVVDLDPVIESSAVQIKSASEQRQFVDAIMVLSETYLSASYSLPELNDELTLIRWRRTIVLCTLAVMYDLVIRSECGQGTAISSTLQRFHLDLCDRDGSNLDTALRDAQFPNEPKMADARSRLIQYFRQQLHNRPSQSLTVYALSGQVQSTDTIAQFITTAIINGQVSNNAKVDRNMPSLEALTILSSSTNQQLDNMCFGLRQYLFLLVHIAISMDHCCLIRPGLYLSVALQPRFIIDKFCSDSAFVCISMMRRKQLRFSNNQSSFVDRLLSKIGTGMQTFLSAQESALLSRIVRDSSGPMTLHLLLDFVACHRLHLINWTCFQQLFTYCLFRCGETATQMYSSQTMIPSHVGFFRNCALLEHNVSKSLVSVCISLAEVVLQDPSCSSSAFRFLYETFTCIVHYFKNTCDAGISRLHQYCKDKMYPRLRAMIESLFESCNDSTQSLEEISKFFVSIIRCRENSDDAKIAIAFIEAWSSHNVYLRDNMLPDAIRCSITFQRFASDTIVSDSFIDEAIRNICFGNNPSLFRPAFAPTQSSWNSSTCCFVENPIISISFDSVIEIPLQGFAVKMRNGSVRPLSHPNLLFYSEENILLRDDSFIAVPRGKLPACLQNVISKTPSLSLWRKLGTTQVATDDTSLVISLKRFFAEPELVDAKAKKTTPKPSNSKAPETEEPPDDRALLLKQYPELREFCGCVHDKNLGHLIREDDVCLELRTAFNNLFVPGPVSYWTNNEPIEPGKPADINRIVLPGGIHASIDKEYDHLQLNIGGEVLVTEAPNEPLIGLLKGFPPYCTLRHQSRGSCHVLFHHPALCIPIHSSQLVFDELRLTVGLRLWIALQFTRLLRFEEAFEMIAPINAVEWSDSFFQSWVSFSPVHPAQCSLRLTIISRFLRDHPSKSHLISRLSEHISNYESLRSSLPLQFRIQRSEWRVLLSYHAQVNNQSINSFHDKWQQIRDLALNRFEFIHPRRWKLEFLTDDPIVSNFNYQGTNSDTVRVCDQIWKAQTIGKGGFVSLYEMLTGRLDIVFNSKRITVDAAALLARVLFFKQFRLPAGPDPMLGPFAIIDCLLFMADGLIIQNIEASRSSRQISLNDQPATLSSFLDFLRFPPFPRGKDGRVHVLPSSSSTEWAIFADRLMSICDAIRPRPSPSVEDDVNGADILNAASSAVPSRASSASAIASRRKGREPGWRWAPARISARQRYDAAVFEVEQPDFSEICQSTCKTLLTNFNSNVDFCDHVSGFLQSTTLWMLISSWLSMDAADQMKHLALSRLSIDSELVLRSITTAVEAGILIGHNFGNENNLKKRYINALESVITFIEHIPGMPASSNEATALVVQAVDKPTIIIADNVLHFRQLSDALTGFLRHPLFANIPHCISETDLIPASIAECLGGSNGLIITTGFAVEKFLANVQLNLCSTKNTENCFEFCHAFQKLSEAHCVAFPYDDFVFKPITFINTSNLSNGRCCAEVFRDRCNLALHILDGFMAPSEAIAMASIRNNDSAFLSTASLAYMRLHKELQQLRLDGVIEGTHFVNYQDKVAVFDAYERHLLHAVLEWAIMLLIDTGICSVNGCRHFNDSTSNLPASDVAKRFILADYAAAACLYERFEYDERSRAVLVHARFWIRQIIPFLMTQRCGITFARISEDDLVARPLSDGRFQSDCIYFQNMDVTIGTTIMMFYSEGLNKNDTERLITQMQNDWFYEGTTPSQYDRPSQHELQSWLGTTNVSLRSLEKSSSLFEFVHDRVCYQLPAIRHYLTRQVLPQITRWPTDCLNVDLRDLPLIPNSDDLPSAYNFIGISAIEALSCAIRSVNIHHLISSVLPSRAVPPELGRFIKGLTVSIDQSGSLQLKRHQRRLELLRAQIASISEIPDTPQQQIIQQYYSLAELMQKGTKCKSNAFRCENDFHLEMRSLETIWATTEPNGMTFAKVSSLPNDSIIDILPCSPITSERDQKLSKHCLKWNIAGIDVNSLHRIAFPLRAENGFTFPSIFTSRNHQNLCDIDVVLELYLTGAESSCRSLFPVRLPSNLRSGLLRHLGPDFVVRNLEELFGKLQIRFPLDECVSDLDHCKLVASKGSGIRPKIKSTFLTREPQSHCQTSHSVDESELNSVLKPEHLKELLDRIEQNISDSNCYFVAITLQEASTLFSLMDSTTDIHQIGMCLRSLDSGNILARSNRYRCAGFSTINSAMSCLHYANGEVQSTDYNSLVMRHILDPIPESQRLRMLKEFIDVSGRIRDLRSWDFSPLAQIFHIGESMLTTQLRKCFAKLKNGIILRYGNNVASCFDYLDRNHDGFITASELEYTLNELKLGFAPQDFQCILLDCDMNSDGVIDFAEFTVLVFGSDTNNDSLKDTIQRHGEIDQEKTEKWKAQLRNEEARKEAVHYELMNDTTRYETMKPLVSSLRWQYHKAMSAAKVALNCHKQILPLQQIHHLGERSAISVKVAQLTQRERQAQEELARSRLHIDEVKRSIRKIDPTFGTNDSYAKPWFSSDVEMNDEDEVPNKAITKEAQLM